ncbi:hypothetical protein ACFSJY_09400 [Thalassotalea euphylliae]|uniref:hypothetical protein n=1 Tax=Thalassotalea euphylliae TaxID=1655234 RepID=UPI0036337802
MKKTIANALLVSVACISSATAITHLSCLYFGPECYAIQMAPPKIIQSAKDSTWLAPLGNIFISSLFILVACYALSAAKIIGKVPLLKLGIYTITTLCIVRGLLPIQLWLRHPEKVTDIVLLVGIAWLMTGLALGIGHRLNQQN